MKRTFLTTFLLVGACSAWADGPRQVYQAVRISTGGPEFYAYAVWNQVDEWKLAGHRPEWAVRQSDEFKMKVLNAIKQVCVTTTLEWLERPTSMPVITTPVSCYGKSSVKSVELSSGSFSGRMSHGGPFLHGPEVIARLKTEPFYQCTTGLGLYWLSYNPKVGAKELDSLCNSEWYLLPKERRDKDLKRMADFPDVLKIEVPEDI